MKRIIFSVLAIATTIAIVTVSCNTEQTKPAIPAPISQDSLIKRGDYLVTSMGCDDCHTPKKMGPHGPEPDMDHRMAGHMGMPPVGKINAAVMKDGWVLMGMDLTTAVGPWGISYAANLTSDTTGIGAWTEEQFLRAIQKGLAKGLEGNRPLLPPMPWMAYKNVKEEDLRAIFAYLKSTKPIKNVVPAWRTLEQL